MPRYYDSRDGDPEADDYRAREVPKKKTSWTTYLLWGLGIIVLIVVALFILSATGNLKGKNTALNQTNTTAQPTQLEQLTAYIITQQNAGMTKDQIIQRLQLAGYSQSDIDQAYQMSDPVIQFILAEEKAGKTRQQIVEELLNQGVAADTITADYAIIDKSRTVNVSDSLKKNWPWIVIALVIVFFVFRAYSKDKEDKKLQPKVYTLDECEEHARQYLTDKGKSYNPSKQYRNRPDIRQYRFVYEEPLFPEFNDHQPTGHKIGARLFYLIAIGYDNEVIDYQEIHDDNRINPFLYGAPKGFEQSGAREYMGLRRTSEQPIEERPQQQGMPGEQGQGPYAPYQQPYYRRPYNRYRPGPVTGYERP